jgi:hypothetical protein
VRKVTIAFEAPNFSEGAMRFVIRNTSDFGLPELKKQSRYADLIVVGSDVLFDAPGNDKLSDHQMAENHTTVITFKSKDTVDNESDRTVRDTLRIGM